MASNPYKVLAGEPDPPKKKHPHAVVGDAVLSYLKTVGGALRNITALGANPTVGAARVAGNIAADPEGAKRTAKNLFSFKDPEQTGLGEIETELSVGALPIAGEIQGVRDVVRDLRAGRPGWAAVNAGLTALPFIGSVGPVARAAREGLQTPGPSAAFDAEYLASIRKNRGSDVPQTVMEAYREALLADVPGMREAHKAGQASKAMEIARQWAQGLEKASIPHGMGGDNVGVRLTQPQLALPPGGPAPLQLSAGGLSPEARKAYDDFIAGMEQEPLQLGPVSGMNDPTTENFIAIANERHARWEELADMPKRSQAEQAEFETLDKLIDDQLDMTAAEGLPSPLGYRPNYSRLNRAVKRSTREVGTEAEWLAEIRKAEGGVSESEITNVLFRRGFSDPIFGKQVDVDPAALDAKAQQFAQADVEKWTKQREGIEKNPRMPEDVKTRKLAEMDANKPSGEYSDYFPKARAALQGQNAPKFTRADMLKAIKENGLRMQNEVRSRNVAIQDANITDEVREAAGAARDKLAPVERRAVQLREAANVEMNRVRSEIGNDEYWAVGDAHDPDAAVANVNRIRAMYYQKPPIGAAQEALVRSASMRLLAVKQQEALRDALRATVARAERRGFDSSYEGYKAPVGEDYTETLYRLDPEDERYPGTLRSSTHFSPEGAAEIGTFRNTRIRSRPQPEQGEMFPDPLGRKTFGHEVQSDRGQMLQNARRFVNEWNANRDAGMTVSQANSELYRTSRERHDPVSSIDDVLSRFGENAPWTSLGSVPDAWRAPAPPDIPFLGNKDWLNYILRDQVARAAAENQSGILMMPHEKVGYVSGGNMRPQAFYRDVLPKEMDAAAEQTGVARGEQPIGIGNPVRRRPGQGLPDHVITDAMIRERAEESVRDNFNASDADIEDVDERLDNIRQAYLENGDMYEEFNRSWRRNYDDVRDDFINELENKDFPAKLRHRLYDARNTDEDTLEDIINDYFEEFEGVDPEDADDYDGYAEFQSFAEDYDADSAKSSAEEAIQSVRESWEERHLEQKEEDFYEEAQRDYQEAVDSYIEGSVDSEVDYIRENLSDYFGEEAIFEDDYTPEPEAAQPGHDTEGRPVFTSPKIDLSDRAAVRKLQKEGTFILSAAPWLAGGLLTAEARRKQKEKKRKSLMQ